MRTLLILMALFMPVHVVQAATISVLSSDNGWVTTSGLHDKANSSIVTGNFEDGTNNFQLFDISSLTGTMTSASLDFFGNNGEYWGDIYETIGIYDVSTSPSNLMNSNPGAAVHNDLEGGNLFGTAVISGKYFKMPAVSIVLNAIGLSALNTAIVNGDNYFALGTTLLTADGNDTLWRSSTFASASQLTVSYEPISRTVSKLPISTVPIPAGGLLLLSGIGVFAIVRKRQKS